MHLFSSCVTCFPAPMCTSLLNVQWISMGPVQDHHVRSYMWWSHVWIWTCEIRSQTNNVCLAITFFPPPPTMLVTATHHTLHHHCPCDHPQISITTNNCPKNEADHPQMKMAAHIQRWTTTSQTNHNHPPWVVNDDQQPRTDTGNDKPRWVSLPPPPNHLSNTGATSCNQMTHHNEGTATTTTQDNNEEGMRQRHSKDTWQWWGHAMMRTRDDEDTRWGQHAMTAHRNRNNAGQCQCWMTMTTDGAPANTNNHHPHPQTVTGPPWQWWKTNEGAPPPPPRNSKMRAHHHHPWTMQWAPSTSTQKNNKPPAAPSMNDDECPAPRMVNKGPKPPCANGNKGPTALVTNGDEGLTPPCTNSKWGPTPLLMNHNEGPTPPAMKACPHPLSPFLTYKLD